MNRTHYLATLLLSTLSLQGYAMDEIRSTLDEQQQLAVTIYNENQALIKDQRKLKIPTGTSNLAFRDVSAMMRPETALLRSVNQSGKISVLEQNFDFDLLTPQKLLDKYVGQNIRVIRTNPATGVETTEEAQVLATNNGTVLKIGDRIETGLAGRLVFPSVPSNLRDRPTLSMMLQNHGSSEQEIELSYLTGGLKWKADYVAELNGNDDKLDLSGWVTLTNTSGATYRNAKLQLVAGDVHRAPEELDTGHLRMRSMAAPMAEAAAPAMSQESLFEYHLYTLERPTTLAENQTKQVALLSASEVPVYKELLLQGNDYYYQTSYGDLGQKMKIGVFVEFENKTASHLGLPMPKGVVRVYKKDSRGNAQLIGEDRIDHTPKNEKIRLKLGDAFDVTANKKQTDFKKIPTIKRNTTYESAYEIVLKNAKKETVEVTIKEPIPADWHMVSENFKHEKAASNTAVWKIKVPAEGETKLNYRVQVTY